MKSTILLAALLLSPALAHANLPADPVPVSTATLPTATLPADIQRVAGCEATFGLLDRIEEASAAVNRMIGADDQAATHAAVASTLRNAIGGLDTLLHQTLLPELGIADDDGFAAANEALLHDLDHQGLHDFGEQALLPEDAGGFVAGLLGETQACDTWMQSVGPTTMQSLTPTTP